MLVLFVVQSVETYASVLEVHLTKNFSFIYNRNRDCSGRELQFMAASTRYGSRLPVVHLVNGYALI